MKAKVSHVIPGLTIILTVLFVSAFLLIFSFMNRQAFNKIESQTKTIEVKSDSISLLKTVLAQELAYHCDTLSVDEKIKQKELDDFATRLSQISDEKISHAYTEKEDADVIAYREQQKESMNAYCVYSDFKHQRLLTWSKAYPDVFLRWVIADFWFSNASTDAKSGNAYWNERAAAEKISSAKDCLADIKSAYDHYQAADKVSEAKYNATQRLNESNYEAKKIQAEEDLKSVSFWK